MDRSGPIGDHLDIEQIAAYVDHEVTLPERERIEAHLATCDECTDEVASVVRTLDTPPEPIKRARRPPFIAAAGIASALLAGALLIGLLRTQQSGDRVLRDSPAAAGEPAAVRIVSPVESEVVEPGRLEFAWRAVEADAAYNLTVTDEGGDVIWIGSSRDTAIALTSQIALSPGEDYFWYVDAILPDGRTLSSGVRTFTAASPE